MSRNPKPTLVARVTATEAREKSIETRLDGVETRLGKIEEVLEQLKGLLELFTKVGTASKLARSFWWFVHQIFAGIGYIAAGVVTIGAAWKFLTGH